MLGTYADTLPLHFRHQHRLARSKSWSNSDIHFFEMVDVSLRYRWVTSSNTSKEMPTLVIIPDPPIMIEHYQELVEQLRPICHILLFEMPGFGFSLPKKALKMDAHTVTRIFSDFLKAINQAPYILHFPCIAGLSATHLAHQHPELVDGLILTQTGTKKHSLEWRKTVDPKNLMGTPFIGQLLLRSQRKKVTQQWLKLALKDQTQLSRFNAICADAYDHGACYCLASALQEFLNPSLPEYEPASVPALVIWGEHDKTHRKTVKEDTKSLVREAQMEVFAHSAHFPDLEEPTRFYRSIARFMAQL